MHSCCAYVFVPLWTSLNYYLRTYIPRIRKSLIRIEFQVQVRRLYVFVHCILAIKTWLGVCLLLILKQNSKRKTRGGCVRNGHDHSVFLALTPRFWSFFPRLICQVHFGIKPTMYEARRERRKGERRGASERASHPAVFWHLNLCWSPCTSLSIGSGGRRPAGLRRQTNSERAAASRLSLW